MAAFAAALLIAQQVAGKATRDALFLSSFAPRFLPWAMAAGAGLSLLAVYGLSRLVTRHSPARVMPWLFFASAAGLVAAWVLGLRSAAAAAVLVYLHTALFGPTTVSTFWSLVNERFDPHTAKRAVARVSGGATLGGVLGGLAAWRASTLMPTSALLLVLAALNAAAAVTVLFLRSTGAPRAPDVSRPGEEGLLASLRVLRNAPFLRNLGILVALGACTSSLLDYLFSVQAVARFGNGSELLSFFSIFWLVVGLLSLLLQVTLGRVALEKLGLAVNIAILPGIIVLGGAFGLAVPGLASASVLRGAEAVQRNTLFRSAYEVLYTPLPEQHKRATKALIDVGFDRVGTVLGSGLVLVALQIFVGRPEPMLLAAVVVLALATFPVARQLHVGYVDALQQGLRDGAAKLELTSLDPEEHGPVSGMGARDEVIARIEAIQPGGLRALVDGLDANELPTRKTRSNVVLLAKACTDLLSGEPRHARRALAALDGQAATAACAILLLGHDELHPHALQALRTVAPAITGQLIDALLDDTTDFAIRRRLPRVLARCSTQRAADGLVLGIADARFEVRYECGRALMKLTDAHPHVVVSREKVIEAIRREIEIEQRVLERQAPDDDEPALRDEAPPLVDMLIRDRVDRSLEHVFTILSLQLEREPLRTAFAALYHADEKYRGTALEYLDTVLPSELRDIVWPYLGEAAPLPTARSAQEILAGLVSGVGKQPLGRIGA